jgi:hypothetical protein
MSGGGPNTFDKAQGALNAGDDLTQAQRLAAASKLMELRQKGPASTYARLFREIALPLGWKDQALMPLFYRGLKDGVKDELCMKDRPEELDEYIALAVAIDNRQYIRRLEKRLAR